MWCHKTPCINWNNSKVNISRSDLVSWEGSEEGQLSSLHHVLPLRPEVEVFGLRSTAEEQDVGWKAERRRGGVSCQSCDDVKWGHSFRERERQSQRGKRSHRFFPQQSSLVKPTWRVPLLFQVQPVSQGCPFLWGTSEFPSSPTEARTPPLQQQHLVSQELYCSRCGIQDNWQYWTMMRTNLRIILLAMFTILCSFSS